jgi:hypothetical protein
LSPAAKVIAIAQAADAVQKSRLRALPVEVESEPVDQQQFDAVKQRLTEAPPVAFDLARQVRVFEPYLQYVELSLSGAAIQRRRLTIPKELQQLGTSKELEGRLRTTFDLIEKGSKLSSRSLEDELNGIRRDLTRSLGKDKGRVILKRAKPTLEKRLSAFTARLQEHQETIKAELQKSLDASRDEVISYYLPIVLAKPPDALVGQILGDLTDDDARKWIARILSKVFPRAEALIQDMKLEREFKDVTFETLNRGDFLESVKNAFPDHDWDKTYSEFKAAGESHKSKA